MSPYNCMCTDRTRQSHRKRMDLTLLEKQLNLKTPLYHFSILQTVLLFFFLFLSNEKYFYSATKQAISEYSPSPIALAGLPELWQNQLGPKSLLLSKWCQYRLPAILVGHVFCECLGSPLPLCAVVRVQRGFSRGGTLPQSCPVGSLSPSTPENSLKKGNFSFDTSFSGMCFLTTTQLKGRASTAGHLNCFKPLHACLIEISENVILFPQWQPCF